MISFYGEESAYPFPPRHYRQVTGRYIRRARVLLFPPARWMASSRILSGTKCGNDSMPNYRKVFRTSDERRRKNEKRVTPQVGRVMYIYIHPVIYARRMRFSAVPRKCFRDPEKNTRCSEPPPPPNNKTAGACLRLDSGSAYLRVFFRRR